MRPRSGSILVAAAIALAACGASDTGPRTLIEFPDALPGDVIALRASDDDPNVVEWIDRRAGTIRATSLDAGPDDNSPIATLARIEVSTDGEQRGLLGHTVVDGVRYAAWTEVDTQHLVVGALTEPDDDTPATVGRIVWDGGGTEGGAVGGHLGRSADGRLVLGIGQRTEWARANDGGAMVLLDPDGPPDQEPEVLSAGYTNPFAFAVVEGLGEPAADRALWVADNAVGDDVERVGRGDLVERADHARSDADPRAPSAVIALPGGDLAICGFLDGQLRRWSTADERYGDELGPCLTGAARLTGGTIVTATDTALVALAP